jgi:hypothetical protein
MMKKVTNIMEHAAGNSVEEQSAQNAFVNAINAKTTFVVSAAEHVLAVGNTIANTA